MTKYPFNILCITFVAQILIRHVSKVQLKFVVPNALQAVTKLLHTNIMYYRPDGFYAIDEQQYLSIMYFVYRKRIRYILQCI